MVQKSLIQRMTAVENCNYLFADILYKSEPGAAASLCKANKAL